MDNNFDPFNTKKKKSNKKAKNFIEAFRDIGSGTAKSLKQDVAGGMAKSAGQQIGGFFGRAPQVNQGELQPNQPFNLENVMQQREQQVRTEERRFAEQRRSEEKVVYCARDQETKLEIKALQEELSKFAKTAGALGKEIEKASFNAVVSPGTYHVNFFQRLRSLLAELRHKIADSQTWLSACNKKVDKRCFYWRQVKKSGTKFMLSQERYMSTQAG
ncbi:hypothetical protein KKD62_03510 [Patescibacteria group bacterium]|nr:hypothetical protein [Patescibacteria group bacterium]MBU1931869.1 hypothetical protein [Patescibacteria group bacterium]